jgi:hypothetical protein
MLSHATLLLAAVLAVPGQPAAAPPPAGNWKVVFPLQSDPTQALWLLKLEHKDGKWTATILDSAQDVPKAAIENLKVDKDQLRFGLKLPSQTIQFEGRLPKDKETKILGSISLGSNTGPAILEATSVTALDPFQLNKETLAQHKEGVPVVRAALKLLGEAQAQKARPEEVRSWADRAAKAAEPFGNWYRDVILTIAEILEEQEGQTAVALQYARQAERLLEPKDPPAFQKRVLTALAVALEKSGKADEAKEIKARSDKIQLVKVTPYAGRKADSKRAVLVELFTGTQSPPCVAAELAFEALGRTYKPTEAVFLEYHLHHQRGPDPLTSPASVERGKFYGSGVENTPVILFNGRPVQAVFGGGGFNEAQRKYDEYTRVIDLLLERPAKATLTVSATRKEQDITIKADVADLAETGPDVRLRLVLVEDKVAYLGGNGVPSHYHVVRDFPGGAEGMALKEKTGTRTVTVNLEELRKKLKEYLEKTNAERPFPVKTWPLDLKGLSVIAFVQNDDSGEVLQAAQVQVKE